VPLSPGASARHPLGRRPDHHLEAPHPHRRRQLGQRRGAARRGRRALRDRHPRRRRRGAHTLRGVAHRDLHRRPADRRLRLPAIVRIAAHLPAQHHGRPRHPPPAVL
jgi:hypothetical protein